MSEGLNWGSIRRTMFTLTIKEDCGAIDTLPHHYEKVKNPAEYEEMKQDPILWHNAIKSHQPPWTQLMYTKKLWPAV